MNLNRMMFWKSSAVRKSEPIEQHPANSMAEEQFHPETPENVISLPMSAESAPQESASEPTPVAPTRPRPRGLLDAPELKAFLEIGHFGHGRYDGTHCRTQEAMDTGKRKIIAGFQNALSEVLEQKVVKVHRLEDAQVETEGVCDRTTARLKLARTHQEREIAELRSQIQLAEVGRGWVLEALNSYQQGFRLGVRSAIEFDLLTQ